MGRSTCKSREISPRGRNLSTGCEEHCLTTEQQNACHDITHTQGGPKGKGKVWEKYGKLLRAINRVPALCVFGIINIYRSYQK